MSRNLGLTSLVDEDTSEDSEDSEKTVLIDLLDPEHPAEYSKTELHELANSVARFVQADGIQPGERVGILGLNSVHVVAAMLDNQRRMS